MSRLDAGAAQHQGAGDRQILDIIVEFEPPAIAPYADRAAGNVAAAVPDETRSECNGPDSDQRGGQDRLPPLEIIIPYIFVADG